MASEHVLFLAAVVIINHTSRTHLQLIVVHPHRHPCARAHTHTNTDTHFLLDPRARHHSLLCYHCLSFFFRRRFESSQPRRGNQSDISIFVPPDACAYLVRMFSAQCFYGCIVAVVPPYHRLDPCLSIQKQSRNKCIFFTFNSITQSQIVEI